MKTTLERHLLQAVERYLKKLQRQNPTLAWRKRHGSPFSTAGDPDIYGVWNGIHFEIELKQEGRDPTPLQTARLAEWKAAGALPFVAHSLAEFQAALQLVQTVHLH